VIAGASATILNELLIVVLPASLSTLGDQDGLIVEQQAGSMRLVGVAI
jgi:hypothetical protein